MGRDSISGRRGEEIQKGDVRAVMSDVTLTRSARGEEREKEGSGVRERGRESGWRHTCDSLFNTIHARATPYGGLRGRRGVGAECRGIVWI